MRSWNFRRRVWLAGAALTLSLAAVLAVAIGASISYRIGLTGSPFYLTTDLTHGALQFVWLPVDPVSGARPGFGNPGWHCVRSASAGVAWTPRWQLGGPVRQVLIPLWAPTLFTGGLGILALRRLRSLRDPALCACGYPRAGLPANSPCPECGRVTGVWQWLRATFSPYAPESKALVTPRAP
jgi:hypothetical protein